MEFERKSDVKAQELHALVIFCEYEYIKIKTLEVRSLQSPFPRIDEFESGSYEKGSEVTGASELRIYIFTL